MSHVSIHNVTKHKLDTIPNEPTIHYDVIKGLKLLDALITPPP